MKLSFLLTLCFTVSQLTIGFAQENEVDTASYTPRSLTADEFLHFQLPPLETLFENAKKNPNILAIQSSIEAAQLDTKKNKRDWWSFFSIHAGFNYGILGVYNDQESFYQPLTTTYTGSTQNSWSIGANFNLPLNKLINYNNDVKKQKRIVEGLEFNREVALNQIKTEIIELYVETQGRLKALESVVEGYYMAKATYETEKNSFINNKISVGELALSQLSMRKAAIEYEDYIGLIQIALLKLQILTNTKLISK